MRAWFSAAAWRRTRQGLGVGLAVVRRLTQLHGRSVEVVSDGLGKGSEFVVRLTATTPPVGEQGAGRRR
jgi:signal transduction histidine kinase